MDINKIKAGDICLLTGISQDAKYGKFRSVTPHFLGGKVFLNVEAFLDDETRMIERNYVLAFNADVKVLTPARAQVVKERIENLKKFDVTLPVLRSAFSQKVGADPEIFVVDAQDKLLPAFKFLPSKAAPIKESSTPLGHRVGAEAYWDGFQAEFRTTADTCWAYGVDSLQTGLRLIHNAAKAYDAKAKLTLESVIEVPSDYLEGAEDEHVALGCDPSFNAYDKKGKEVASGRLLPIRMSGGHLHFGPETMIGNFFTKAAAPEYVKTLDAIVGVACVSLFAELDIPLRREYYGLAGEYRLPAHGLEYRTLSNAWLSHPAIAHLVMDTARLALQLQRANLSGSIVKTDEVVQDIINHCDVKAARKYLDANKPLFASLLRCKGALYGKWAWKVFRNGIDVAIDEPRNIEKNWKLEGGAWASHSNGENCQFGKLAISLEFKSKSSAVPSV